MSADDLEQNAASAPDGSEEEEHFKPTGTIFLLACYVFVILLLWASVYLILLSRGVTV